MRSKLLSSFLTVFLFWWLFFLFKWGLGSLQDNFKSLTDIKKLLPFLNIKIPESGISQALYIQLTVIKTWTIPIVVLGVISTIIGVAIVWMYAYRYYVDRLERVKPKGNWRGAYIGAIGGGGALPLPEQLKKLKLANESVLAHEKVQKLKEKEIVLLREILETLYAYPDAYCGDGHDSSLYQHTIHVIEKLLQKEKVSGLTLIVAAAHDMGKITAFQKNDKGKFIRVKHHDKESAKLLALMPSFWDFEEIERRVMLMATKYGHTPGDMPSFEKEDITMKKAMDILHIIHEVDRQATKEEKQRVLDKTEIEKVILESFINVLPTLHFQKPGLPKGAISSGWKIKGRLYLNEIQVREICMKNLDKDVRAALGGNYREKTEVTPFTSALLKAFNDKNWLVKTIDNKTVDYSEALWKIKAGTREFNGIIIIENLPSDVKSMLDSADTTYKLDIIGPQFEKELSEPDSMGLFKDKKSTVTETNLKVESSKEENKESNVVAQSEVSNSVDTEQKQKKKEKKSFTNESLEISLEPQKIENDVVKSTESAIQLEDKNEASIVDNITIATETVPVTESDGTLELISSDDQNNQLIDTDIITDNSSDSGFSLSGFLSTELQKEDSNLSTDSEVLDKVEEATENDQESAESKSEVETSTVDIVDAIEDTIEDKKQESAPAKPKKKDPYGGLFK